MNKISIIEDTEVLARQMATVISAVPNFRLCGVHHDAKSALELIPIEQPDVVILDIGLPGKLSGLDCLIRLKHDYPSIEFIVHTGLSEEDLLFKALKLGASGYLQKDGTVGPIINAINTLIRGGAPMSMSIARRVLRSFWEPDGNIEGFEQLTKRQLSVVELIASGLQNIEIGGRLGITEGGVRGHLNRIYRKMHINNRTELAILYKELQARLSN